MSITTAPANPADHAGMTRLACGTRVEKDSPTIELLGTIEELSAWVAVLADDPPSDDAGRILVVVGNDLDELSRQVAAPGFPLLSDAYVRRLAEFHDNVEAYLPPRVTAQLPGGTPRAAAAAVARCVCRRVERRLVSYRGLEGVGIEADHALAYLNALGDLLDQIGRLANHTAGRFPRKFDRSLSFASSSTVDDTP